MTFSVLYRFSHDSPWTHYRDFHDYGCMKDDLLSPEPDLLRPGCVVKIEGLGPREVFVYRDGALTSHEIQRYSEYDHPLQPWIDETRYWSDNILGFRVKAVRDDGDWSNHWCGYLYPGGLTEAEADAMENVAYGGVTFGPGRLSEGDDDECIGFDCNHSRNVSKYSPWAFDDGTNNPVNRVSKTMEDVYLTDIAMQNYANEYGMTDLSERQIQAVEPYIVLREVQMHLSMMAFSLRMMRTGRSFRLYDVWDQFQQCRSMGMDTFYGRYFKLVK